MRIAIIGYGKMGRTIEKLAQEAGHEIVLKVEVSETQNLVELLKNKVEVAIEFTRPEAAFDNITACFEAGVPVVSGTTAWLDRYEEACQVCAIKQGAFFYASNFSIGVNLFFAVNKYLAQLIDDYEQYDVQMEEIHHTQKLDAPSGTAITLAEGIMEKIARKTKWELDEPSDEKTISIISKRIDPTPGTHTVRYYSEIDDIKIEHVAHSRQGFAKGALRAAEWLVGKQGVFGMKDLLGI